MQSQWSVKLHTYLLVGILLIVLPVIGSSKRDSSILNEDGGPGSHIRVSSGLERYIMTPYFEEHGSWPELDLKEFLQHELSLASCKALPDDLSSPRLLVSERYLVGEGSHRQLVSSVRIDTQAKSFFDLAAHFCELLIIERLPLGVFADPFELEHLLQRGVYKDAAVFGDTNLESPTVHSNQSFVEIHVNLVIDKLLKDNQLNVKIELPLHARYPPLDESGYVRVDFGQPNVFMRCNLKAKSQNQSCLLMSKGDGTKSTSRAVVWQIPSGMKAHAGIVSLVTAISALLSAVLIIATSIHYSDIQLQKNLKQS